MTAVIPFHDRNWVREHGEAPALARVFIAATDDRWWGDVLFDDHKLQMTTTQTHEGRPPGNYKGYVATIVIRHLALQVIGTPFKDTKLFHQPPIQGNIERIWPFYRSFMWPPGLTLGPDALRALIAHWKGAPSRP